ncbi:MAG: hypothetical protein ACJ79H_13340 [Myxococcales bacterium]
MPYRVQLRCAVGSVPSPTLGRLRARLREIGHTLSTVSGSSAFWSSMADSPLFVDVDGWRFKYVVERESQVLAVVDVSRVSDAPAAYERARSARNRY